MIFLIPDKIIHAIRLILPSKYVISNMCRKIKTINEVIHALLKSDKLFFVFKIPYLLLNLKLLEPLNKINSMPPTINNEDGKP